MSEINTKCSHCHSVFEVDEKYINQITACPDCGKEFVLEKMKISQRLGVYAKFRYGVRLVGTASLFRDKEFD